MRLFLMFLRGMTLTKAKSPKTAQMSEYQGPDIDRMLNPKLPMTILGNIAAAVQRILHGSGGASVLSLLQDEHGISR